ncbi:MAG: hypothetical protein WAX20_07755 [Enterococcus aquimarinus]
MNENANQNKELEELEVDLEFESMEGYLSKQLEASFSDLSLLEEDRKNIANPESLGKTILNEVWKQFGNQIGLDITNETLIQQYDRKHPETYDDIKKEILKDKSYTKTREQMKSDQMNRTLVDTYTGKTIKPGEKFDVDHVVSRKEIFENQRRKQANFSTGELANKDENKQATNASLNRSKKEKTVNDYLGGRELREADLIKQNEKANKKVDGSNLSNLEKRLQKEKNDKALQNKLDADDELMKQSDKTARKAINKDIATGAVKEVGIKAGKDALKTAAIAALFSLLKEIMNGFVRFLKSQSKTFSNFLAEMKTAINSFFSKIMSVVQTGVSALVGTIVSEIFGPIVSVFKKLASFIKQGVSSFVDAINYLKDKSNKNKPFSIKVAQVGKIVTAGLTIGSAIVLGEVFEKFLLTIPGMQIALPLLGTLANLIGLFLGSLISGLVGAIVLNLIDRLIATKLRSDTNKDIIEKQNDVVNIQQIQKVVAEKKVEKTKATGSSEIRKRHEFVREHIETALERLADKPNTTTTKDVIIITENSDDFSKMQKDLEDLL